VYLDEAIDGMAVKLKVLQEKIRYLPSSLP